MKMNTTSDKTNKLNQTVKTHWQKATPRDKRLFVAAGILLGAAISWWILLSPAIKTILSAPKLHKNLDAQIQTMKSLSLEARNLQEQNKLGVDDGRQALQNTVTQRFGSTAQLNVQGSRATLTLKNANPQSVSDFLSQARINARTLPTEVKLMRSAPPSNGWDGNMTLVLPTK